MTTCDFEEGNITGLEFRIVPGQVRCGSVHTGRQQRQDSGVVAPVLVYAFDTCVEYLGGKFVFLQSWFDDVVDVGVHVFDDTRRTAHVGQFLF